MPKLFFGCAIIQSSCSGFVLWKDYDLYLNILGEIPVQAWSWGVDLMNSDELDVVFN